MIRYTIPFINPTLMGQLLSSYTTKEKQSEKETNFLVRGQTFWRGGKEETLRGTGLPGAISLWDVLCNSPFHLLSLFQPASDTQAH